jgi:protein-ribulosamine 3-kinase
MITKALLARIEEQLQIKTGTHIRISEFSPVAGGSINQAFQLRSNEGDFFLKKNDARLFPGMFETEEKGLGLLSKHSSFRIPQVLFCDVFKDEALILMEYIQPGIRSSGFFEEFGKRLAAMHKVSNASFGLDQDNYIGSLPQNNTLHSDWSSFFIEARLRPQVEMARNAGKIDAGIVKQFESLFNKLDTLFPAEPSSLLHGDLWSGNFMEDENGVPCIFDPAVYFGHREMDLAMTKLFGGFGPEMYESYNEVYPLENGWKERIDICNLYPLMVHANLFGESYVWDVKGILGRF